MYISLRIASCLGTQDFLFLNCQWSLVLPHLLLGSFMNFVVELYSQQGSAIGVRSFKGKRGFGSVRQQAMNCQCLRTTHEGRSKPWLLLCLAFLTHGLCFYNNYALSYLYCISFCILLSVCLLLIAVLFNFSVNSGVIQFSTQQSYINALVHLFTCTLM